MKILIFLAYFDGKNKIKWQLQWIQKKTKYYYYYSNYDYNWIIIIMQLHNTTKLKNKK